MLGGLKNRVSSMLFRWFDSLRTFNKRHFLSLRTVTVPVTRTETLMCFAVRASETQIYANQCYKHRLILSRGG
jgi:hypothetical protein